MVIFHSYVSLPECNKSGIFAKSELVPGQLVEKCGFYYVTTKELDSNTQELGEEMRKWPSPWDTTDVFGAEWISG